MDLCSTAIRKERSGPVMEAKTKSRSLDPQTIRGHHGMPEQLTVARGEACMQPQASGVVIPIAFEHQGYFTKGGVKLVLTYPFPHLSFIFSKILASPRCTQINVEENREISYGSVGYLAY